MNTYIWCALAYISVRVGYVMIDMCKKYSKSCAEQGGQCYFCGLSKEEHTPDKVAEEYAKQYAD